MEFSIINSIKGDFANCEVDNKIESTDEFLNIIVNSPEETIILKKDSFSDHFYDLKTKLAGEMLQKLVNHKMRLIILGDFNNITSNSLRDFIFESNRQGKIIFADNLDEAVEFLK
ncbi:DUF4180 domain-containing protein [Leptospira ilyithenensis]|uniref:DUF4180 domain-containing protein n=1 Tax=Leptospira ilyithenensis TaxID=2484901 RepID=A0A4R9LSM6_9LEPT|nr:DUF4180 domain-containing protein [Leptospira ilyithenensis]TGN11892.1 DUF4180 domain-containing protein [Leptospira ilyithenensis]